MDLKNGEVANWIQVRSDIGLLILLIDSIITTDIECKIDDRLKLFDAWGCLFKQNIQ